MSQSLACDVGPNWSMKGIPKPRSFINVVSLVLWSLGKRNISREITTMCPFSAPVLGDIDGIESLI